MKRFRLAALILFLVFPLCNLPSRAETSRDPFPTLRKLIAECRTHQKAEAAYFVPQAWFVDPARGPEQLAQMAVSETLIQPVRVRNPYSLCEQAVNKILLYHETAAAGEQIDLATGKGVVAVNSLPRVLSMYDHDGDGSIGSSGSGDITLNSSGVREMGTFVKNILVLPYLKALGFNTVHLQPITDIGVFGKKGNLGSPFAIRDPFSIDSRLADPLFEMDAGTQYLAFIEAAHALGMKVVQEVIPRTVSLDSKILEKNPEFGYWVKDGCTKRMPNYYSPDYEYRTAGGKKRFQDRESFEKWFYDEYKKKIYSGNYGIEDLIDVTKTDPEYVNYFMAPPDLVKREENGKLTGCYYRIDDKGKKSGGIDEAKKSEVFPAFCDTPFEIQPFWQDVTYLRLYINGDTRMPMLDPLSYVTAKFFMNIEPRIEKLYRNKPVWDMITRYFDKFRLMGVDGFVLDMGHALPEDLKGAIRKVLPVVWEENLGVGFPYLAENSIVVTGNVFAYGEPAYNDSTDLKLYEEHPERAVKFHIRKMHVMFGELSPFDVHKGKMFGFPDNYNTKRIGQSPATRDLTRAPLNSRGVPDFTLAPVDPVKRRKITLLYYTLFRIISEKEGSPFVFNPVFGTEFVATSTVNVGLNTPIKEANMFYEYMSPEERQANPHAEKLLLMSKPDSAGGEWTGKEHIVGEILTINKALVEMTSLLKRDIHLEVAPSREPEILHLTLKDPRGGAEELAIIANLDLDAPHAETLSCPIKRFYLGRLPAFPAESAPTPMLMIPPGEMSVMATSGRAGRP